MSYIERLQDDKKLLVEFFDAYMDLEAKERRFENTAYKGDARRAADAAHATLNAIKVRVQEMLSRPANKKEAANA